MREFVHSLVGSPRRLWHLLPCLSFILLLTAGCQPGARRNFEEKFKHYTPRQNYEIARNNDNPNERRRAVARIAASNIRDDEAFSVLDELARNDESEQVRCIAIRGLGGFHDGRPVKTMFVLLNPKAHPDESRAATAQVRWDAAQALLKFVENHAVADADIAETLDIFGSLLLHDTSREVKIAAAKALGYIEDVRGLRALIAGLRYKDFGVAYAAHASLVQLTGQRYEYDADGWDAWLTSNPRPFDRAVTTSQAAQ